MLKFQNVNDCLKEWGMLAEAPATQAHDAKMKALLTKGLVDAQKIMHAIIKDTYGTVRNIAGDSGTAEQAARDAQQVLQGIHNIMNGLGLGR